MSARAPTTTTTTTTRHTTIAHTQRHHCLARTHPSFFACSFHVLFYFTWLLADLATMSTRRATFGSWIGVDFSLGVLPASLSLASLLLPGHGRPVPLPRRCLGLLLDTVPFIYTVRRCAFSSLWMSEDDWIVEHFHEVPFPSYTYAAFGIDRIILRHVYGFWVILAIFWPLVPSYVYHAHFARRAADVIDLALVAGWLSVPKPSWIDIIASTLVYAWIFTFHRREIRMHWSHWRTRLALETVSLVLYVYVRMRGDFNITPMYVLYVLLAIKFIRVIQSILCPVDHCCECAVLRERKSRTE